MEIEFTKNPETSDVNFITERINEEIQDFGLAYPFAFFVRDVNDKIIAGCNGSVVFGCIYTDQLWVEKGQRKTGLGRKLMNEVHDYGRKNGCKIATVSTMSFQGALSFYKKLGYMIDFERYGYAKNSSCLFLRKEL